jgi:hypothetical protein
MPLMQIFKSFSGYFDSFSRNAEVQRQVRHTSNQQNISVGSKRQQPEEAVLEENRKDPLWNISDGGSIAYSQQPLKRQRNESHHILSNETAGVEKKSLPSKASSDFAFELPLLGKQQKQPTSVGYPPSSVNAHDPTNFVVNQAGGSGSALQLPASFDDIVYVRKSLLSPEQLQVAAATEQAIRAHETLRSLRSKAMSRTVADSRTAHTRVQCDSASGGNQHF